MSNLTSNEGRSIKTVFWPDQVGDVGSSMHSDEEKSLVYHSEYHGDHSENWVLVMKGDVETARHNTRFIESIIWSD